MASIWEAKMIATTRKKISKSNNAIEFRRQNKQKTVLGDIETILLSLVNDSEVGDDS